MMYERDGVVVREARAEDIQELKDRLREADAQEIIAAGNKDGEAVLRQSFSRSSMRYSVVYRGVVVAMFGVVPDRAIGGSANVWFLGAPEMGRIKKTFVRLSRVVIAMFLSQYAILWNLVDCRYEKTFGWLKSCGARFEDRPSTINGVPFLCFTIYRGDTSDKREGGAHRRQRSPENRTTQVDSNAGREELVRKESVQEKMLLYAPGSNKGSARPEGRS